MDIRLIAGPVQTVSGQPHGNPTSYAVDKPKLVGSLEIVERQPLFADCPSLQQLGSKGPGQQSALAGRSEPLTVALEYEVSIGELREFPLFIPQEHVEHFRELAAPFLVHVAAGRLVEQKRVLSGHRRSRKRDKPGILAGGCQADPALSCGGLRPHAAVAGDPQPDAVRGPTGGGEVVAYSV